ncbi:hypothetical protein GCM10009583_32020 [Ornithinicoccus hortensis]|uniref:UPF0716 protein FxsA n=1 Tax=Ornithinicoccus hortensis TaxID=82346 RepID=A0A542YSZ6_9MICO|nr:FxsA family protein [Ornithinicoccus hortensis]TQL51219.1 UPF0716 protein FxsA [Ornithinicoccus hortensis]
MPLVEVIVLILVGRQIGAGWTLLALLATCLIGAVLVKRESARTWKSLRRAVDSGRVPGREVADAALVLVGGLLLLVPGFVTDVVGLFLILPLTRPITRAWLAAVIGSRVLDGVVPGTVYGPTPGRGEGAGPTGFGPPTGGRGGDIIEGEIIDEDPPPGR